ncbi:MAG TPA: hypothetical protein VJI32_05260 [Candidatus Nanoarchaeia archaeon]|nr:hypothetical protein [Candidatus Nanoarchaeia archaeon]
MKSDDKSIQSVDLPQSPHGRYGFIFISGPADNRYVFAGAESPHSRPSDLFERFLEVNHLREGRVSDDFHYMARGTLIIHPDYRTIEAGGIRSSESSQLFKELGRLQDLLQRYVTQNLPGYQLEIRQA